jgi:hypothetical protein
MKKLLIGIFSLVTVLALFTGCETCDQTCPADCRKPCCAQGQAK